MRLRRTTSAETAARFLAMRARRFDCDPRATRRAAARLLEPRRPPPAIIAAPRPTVTQHATEILGEIFRSADVIDQPRVQTFAVPADFVVYRVAISADQTIAIPLPPRLTRRDVERLYAFLLTQVDDDDQAPIEPGISISR